MKSTEFGSNICSLQEMCGGPPTASGCGNDWIGLPCSEDEPFCDVFPFEKVYKSEDDPGCCATNKLSAKGCKAEVMQCPDTKACAPSTWPVPSNDDRKAGNDGSRDGCGGTCGGETNPMSTQGCKTGDMNMLTVTNAEKKPIWNWHPHRGTLAKPGSLMGPTVFDGMILTVGPSDDQSLFYDNGVCVGQAPAMKPTLSLTFNKQLFPMSIYAFFDACTSYLFTSDNVGVSVVSAPQKGNQKLIGADLNGSMSWTMKATWPNQDHWFFGGVPRNWDFKINDNVESSESISPISCVAACKNKPAYFTTYVFQKPECHCLAPDTASVFPTDMPRNPANNSYWMYQTPLDYPETPNSQGQNFHTMIHDPEALTQLPKPPFEKGTFMYRKAPDLPQHLEYLLYFYNPGNDPVTQSSCVTSPSSDIWGEGNSATSLCNFATVVLVTNSKPACLIRFKAGSDPNGFGSTIYIQPFYAPNSVNVPPEDTKIDLDKFTTDDKQPGGFITVSGTYNGGPVGGPATSKGTWVTTITFTNVSRTEATASCQTTLSGFTNKDAYDGFNLMQIASNSVLGTKCDSQLRSSDIDVNGKCQYPSNRSRYLPDLVCDDTCSVQCESSTGALPPGTKPDFLSNLILYFTIGGAGLLILLLLIFSIK